MTLANKLTLARLAMTVVFVGLLLAPKFELAYTLALLAFIAAAITDHYDGIIARQRNERTTFGELMDPLADKILVLSAFIIFATMRFADPLGVPLVPVWSVLVIITREFAVTGLRVLAAAKGESIAAGAHGKGKTASQIVAVIVILTGEAFDHDWSKRVLTEPQLRWLDVLPTAYFVATLVAVTFTVTSGVYYFWKHRHLLETRK